MPTVYTSELIGRALDWAVAKALGRLDSWTRDEAHPGTSILDIGTDERGDLMEYQPGSRLELLVYKPWSPSTDWAQGGPITEHLPGFILRHERDARPDLSWVASLPWPNRFNFGPTPLIAVLRCFVTLRLGSTVDIPEELL